MTVCSCLAEVLEEHKTVVCSLTAVIQKQGIWKMKELAYQQERKMWIILKQRKSIIGKIDAFFIYTVSD